MSKEIKELENKYLVLKWEDIENLLSPTQRRLIQKWAGDIQIKRQLAGKRSFKKYLVLNLDDDIDMVYLTENLGLDCGKMERFKVKDVAIDLVNVILKAKE